MNNKKTIINVISSLIVFSINLLINFWLSPYIVKNIGVEANGFVTLANNFIVYAQLVVLALNSMAARFISIEYNKQNYKKANMYYNSVFWGNLIIVIIFLLPSLLFVLKLEYLINVPNTLVVDVKILFTIIFLNFFIQTGLPNWDCGAFVSNRMDRAYIPQAISSVIKCILIICLFTLISPKIYYVGIAALIYSFIILFFNAYNTKTLTPNLKIKLKKGERICSKNAIKELVGSGIWSTISNVGNILLSGLDLIVCNIFIDAISMGVLSLSKVVTNCLEQLSSQVRNALMPELTINYAKENKEKLLKNINTSMKITMVILTIPLAAFIVFGDSFYSIWVPSQNSKLLWILSILSILSLILTTGTQILYNVFDITNKVKYNSFAMIISGIISFFFTVILVKFTNLGIYAVACVSSLVNILRNMLFTLPVTAKLLGFKWYVFYRQVLSSFRSVVMIVFIGFIVKSIHFPVTLMQLVLSVFITCFMGIIINLFFVLNKSERISFKNKFLKIK